MMDWSSKIIFLERLNMTKIVEIFSGENWHKFVDWVYLMKGTA